MMAYDLKIDGRDLVAIAGRAEHAMDVRDGTAGVSVAPDGQPRIRARVVDGLTVVDFVNAEVLFVVDAVQELGGQLNRLVDDGHTRLLLDFRGVHYLSGALISKLVGLHRRVERAHGWLGLCGLGPIPRDTLRICHLERMFKIFIDEAEALDSVRGVRLAKPGGLRGR
jgi:anti-sigma B factor antagonist